MVNNAEKHELERFVQSNASLKRQQYEPIIKNLAAKKARGVYQHALAVKLFRYMVDNADKMYFSGATQAWATKGQRVTTSTETRNAVANSLAWGFEQEYDRGSYDSLVPKKYQKKANPRRGQQEYRIYSETDGYGTVYRDWYTKADALKTARALAKEYPESSFEVYHEYSEQKVWAKKARKSNPKRGKLPKERYMSVLGGYELDMHQQGKLMHRTVPTRSPGADYGADPIGGGMFRMVPSGDVVDTAERNRRLGQKNPRRRPARRTTRARARR